MRLYFWGLLQVFGVISVCCKGFRITPAGGVSDDDLLEAFF